MLIRLFILILFVCINSYSSALAHTPPETRYAPELNKQYDELDDDYDAGRITGDQYAERLKTITNQMIPAGLDCAIGENPVAWPAEKLQAFSDSHPGCVKNGFMFYTWPGEQGRQNMIVGIVVKVKRPPPSYQIGQMTTLKGKYLLAVSEDAFNKASGMASVRDGDALGKLMLAGQITFTDDGEEVYVVNIHPFSGLAEVRRKGQVDTLWTNIEALN